MMNAECRMMNVAKPACRLHVAAVSTGKPRVVSGLARVFRQTNQANAASTAVGSHIG